MQSLQLFMAFVLAAFAQEDALHMVQTKLDTHAQPASTHDIGFMCEGNLESDWDYRKPKPQKNALVDKFRTETRRPVHQTSPEDAIWEGHDVIIHQRDHHREPATLLAGRHAMHRNESTHAFTKMQIVGMFDSGTNLLDATLRKNFRNYAHLCAGVLKDVPHYDWSHCFWDKHLTPAENDAKLTPDTLLVQLVRSPLDQIASWSKAGYGLAECSEAIGNWTPCTLCGKEYPGGVADVWNSYMRGYASTQRSHDNVITVEYERLVVDPEAVVMELAVLLDVKWNGKVQLIEDAAKKHGEAHGRDRAIENLKKRTYLSHLPKGNIKKTLCDRLDTDVMNEHEMPVGFVTHHRSYAADCTA